MNWKAILDAIDSFLHALVYGDAPIPQTVPQTPVIAPQTQPLVHPLIPEVLQWDTPQQAWHATRVLCDEAGLTFKQKNILCACVFQESRFLTNPKPNQNKDPKTGIVWSTDYGIVQINDHFHIGKGKDFPSIQYVLDNPDKCIDYMIGIYKHTGALQPWSSYTTGAYKQWLPITSDMWKLAVGN